MTQSQPDPVEAKPTLDVPAGNDTAPPAGAGIASGRLRLEPGASPLPDYQLVQFLGRGGFGEVWKALGPGGFAVALKFIPLAGQPGEERSAELLKAKEVRHPNLLGLFGSWRRDDLLIVAMELADRTLLDRLNESIRQGQSGVPLPELLEYMREAAKGLDHLHAIGVHHRDVKPQNLLLVGGGVKVADFGLAKLLEQTSISSSGAMTPAYAAPEFLRGRVSAHSDQYALAVTYCQLRGGRLPFEGGAAQVLTGHLCEPPDLTMLPDAERLIVARALAKEPHERWPTCRDFVHALAAPSSELPHWNAPTVSFPANRPRRRGLALTLIGLLLLLTAVAPFAWTWLNRAPPLPDGPVENPPVVSPVETVPPNVGETPAKEPPPVTVESTKDFANTLAMRLTLIPAGKFQMGSPEDEKGRYDNEGPQHEVTITHPFYLGVYPVTKGQFAAFVDAEHYETEAETDGKGGHGYNAVTRTFEGRDPKYTWKDTGFPQADDHPVVNVSWNDAVKFCAWLSQKEGKTYELPTEAEWEYACRAGTTTRFWCGDDDATLNGADNVRDASLKEILDAEQFKDWTFPPWNDGYPFTSPAGKFRANAWGLYDLHGNVWQWCADRHEKYQDGSRTDPTGPAEGDFRVLRGGSWHSNPALCRSAARHAYDPTDCGADVGFRVVLRPPAKTP